MNSVQCRSRGHYLIALIVVIALGLPTRLWPQVLPPFLVNYGGDALWALAIFLLLGLLFPAARTRTLTLAAFTLTWGIEFSELYRADWINAIRATRLGGLILGYTFLPSDLLCYSVGIGVGALLERAVLRRRAVKHPGAQG
jgi:hypothetical protein